MRRHARNAWYRVGGFALLTALIAGLAACGQTVPPEGIGGSSGNGSAGGTPGSGTPGASHNQGFATPTPTGGINGPPPAQSGVTVTLDGSQYGVSSTIIVTVHNHLTGTIVTTDHQSQCTMVTMQRDVNGTWEMVNRCELMIMTRTITLAAGSATAVKLLPRGAQSNATTWPTGTYRIAFAYSVGAPGSPPQSASTAYSPTFTIS